VSEVSKLLKLRCDVEGTVKFMCSEHGFSEERISKALERIGAASINTKQSGIDSWL
jgi:hypothetical protein